MRHFVHPHRLINRQAFGIPLQLAWNIRRFEPPLFAFFGGCHWAKNLLRSEKLWPTISEVGVCQSAVVLICMVHPQNLRIHRREHDCLLCRKWLNSYVFLTVVNSSSIDYYIGLGQYDVVFRIGVDVRLDVRFRTPESILSRIFFVYWRKGKESPTRQGFVIIFRGHNSFSVSLVLVSVRQYGSVCPVKSHNAFLCLGLYPQTLLP